MTQQQKDKRPDPNLVSDIATFISRYVVLPSADHALVLALWVLHTWTFETAQATPYLYVHSADKQSGKTRLLEVLELIIRNPLRATSITPSVLFRAIDVMKPALLWDEIDTVWAGARNEIQRSIVNGGYRRGGFVLRIQSQQPRKFDTYCAKCLAGIFNGFLPDTIQDRCIPIRLKRKDKGQHTEPFYPAQINGSNEHENLLGRIEDFTKRYTREVAYQRPDPIGAISDRQNEISEALLSLAIVLGLEAPTRKAITEMFATVKEAPSLSDKLLTDLREAFGDREKCFTEDLVTNLGGSWTGKLLSQWLAPYDVQPQGIRIGNRTSKGYHRHQLEPIWSNL